MNKDLKAEFDCLLPSAQLTRRSFVVTALGAGFALATRPIMAQTAISTNADGLLAGEVNINGLAAYRAQPAGGANLPTILVVSEIFGVHEHIADICRRLAKLGYLAIAPELFARYGDPRQMSNIQDILGGIIAKVPDHEVIADLDACAAWAAKSGGDAQRLGITGFCWGGRITWMYSAHNPMVKAGVAWYGRIDGELNDRTPRWPLEIIDDLKAPVLGLYGGKDQGIPLDDINLMADDLKAADSPSRIHIYPDAGHAFHADYRSSYRKEAAEDGWRRMREWLTSHGV